jgi:thiopurine S-methyltransferase
MEADFWNQRWESGRIAFHQGRVNPMLDTHVGELALSAGDRIFVPLCGKAVDMRWLADRSYRVIGVELSPVAVRDFFEEQAMPSCKREAHGFSVREGESVALWCGDFFALSRETLGEVAAVYDRAALVALPDAMRARYVDHLLQVVGPRTPILLLTYEYPEAEMEGPPFSVGVEEVYRRFEDHRPVAVLESRDVLEQEPGLRRRGLTQLTEHAFLLGPADSADDQP